MPQFAYTSVVFPFYWHRQLRQNYDFYWPRTVLFTCTIEQTYSRSYMAAVVFASRSASKSSLSDSLPLEIAKDSRRRDALGALTHPTRMPTRATRYQITRGRVRRCQMAKIYSMHHSARLMTIFHARHNSIYSIKYGVQVRKPTMCQIDCSSNLTVTVRDRRLKVFSEQRRGWFKMIQVKNVSASLLVIIIEPDTFEFQSNAPKY
ncbi:hypothetical protein EVAR_103462_1 [Eumeta japonica]|uniref:Uncharacterized protein n=1 Tax=Eumeta variegata TaxID=151549 RepID=A0A4C1YXB8_EUMVA|nr:hypothetical protein EVAR_103462_1 [Eumeta japonica]